MVNALFDTNVLIDYLAGVPQARDELARYEQRSISTITRAEILIRAADDTQTAIRAWLESFELIVPDRAVVDRAVDLRRKWGIRLPDAIIWASAQIHSLLLVSRNATAFPDRDPGVRIPYEL